MNTSQARVEPRVVNRSLLVRWLWATTGVLVVLGVLIVLVGGRSAVPSYVYLIFDLDIESTFATWFSSALFAFSGSLCLLLVREQSFDGKLSRYWQWLGILLWIFSVDEAVGLHERSALGVTLSGALSSAWVIPGTILVIGLGSWYFFAFIRWLPAPLKVRVLAAAAVYVIGALGLEYVESAVFSGWLFGVLGEETLPRGITVALQEAMEMSGLILFVDAILRFIDEMGISFRLAVQGDRSNFLASH